MNPMHEAVPSLNDFLKMSSKGNLIPVYKEILSDMDTPVSAYQKLAEGTDYSFLLESVEGEEKVSRYSFIARNPEAVLRSDGQEIQITRFTKNGARTEAHPITATPLEFIRQMMSQYQFVPLPELPRFCGGMVGYMSYDIVRFFERLPEIAKDDLKLPEALLILAKEIIIFDHRNRTIKVIECVSIDARLPKSKKTAAYQKALKRIDSTIAQLRSPLRATQNKRGRIKPKQVKLHLHSNLSEEQYSDLVRRAKRDIRSGEIIQVVLSQRFEVKISAEPIQLYRALRVLNPSPYMYFLNFKEVQIVGSSPELLVRCENRQVETRPIAGTRPRGKDEEEDRKLAQDLLNDPKEKAEHIMLVDLGRNDLGRVCRQGTVKVSEFMGIENYSHVMHIVSNVKGILKPGQDDFDVLKAAFPAGTVSGAPKIRAMEIIEELEPVRRGPYAGCIGYFSFSGNLDTCITIRTIVVQGKTAYIQAGAGIVADSQPKKEYQETVNKAKAQIKAIELAHRL